MRKIPFAPLTFLFLSPIVVADDTATFDPADLTQVYTQAAMFVTSDADVRVSGMLTGAWTDDIQFAGFIEGIIGDRNAAAGKDALGADYLGGRAQYFQVHAINNPVMPRVGFMTDIIHQKNTGFDDNLLFSAGAIGLINPAYTGGTMIFPNVNYTMGDVFGETVDGFMLNVFATIPFGDQGAFVQAWPEYLKVTGETVEMTSMAYNLMLNAPVNSARSQWLMTKLAYSAADRVLPHGEHLEGDYELKAEIGMKWFF